MKTYGWAGLSGGLEPGKNELYTPFSAVEEGLRRYRHCFAGKTVICNCDDPCESSFVKYFVRDFASLGLKKLIAVSCYGSPAAGEEVSPYDLPGLWDGPSPAYKLVIDSPPERNNVRTLVEGRKELLTRLKGDGDFQSGECVRLLQTADVAVTTPPFSMFGEYLSLLVREKRKFLLLGRLDSVFQPGVLTLIRKKRVRPDFGNPCGEVHFRVPGVYPVDSGDRLRRVKGICWFTNLK